MRPAPDTAALTVAMALAPGVYARNRLFAMYKDPAVRAARARAAALRGVVRQLGGAQGEVTNVRFLRTGARTVLTYELAQVRLSRTVELTELEAACLSYMGGRAGVRGMTASAEDRALIDAALRRLVRLGTDIDAAALERIL